MVSLTICETKTQARQFSLDIYEDNIDEDRFNVFMSKFLHSPRYGKYQGNFVFDGELECGAPIPPIKVIYLLKNTFLVSFLILRCPVLISTSTNTTTLEITYNRCTDYEKLPKKPTLLVEKGFLQCGPSTLPCGLLMRFLNYPKPSPGHNSYGVFSVN